MAQPKKPNSKTSPTSSINEKDAKLVTEYIKKQIKGQKENLSIQEDLTKAKEDELSIAEKLISQEKEILNLIESRKKAAREYNDYARDMTDLLKNQSREQKIQSGDLVKEMALQKKKLKLELSSLDVNTKFRIIEKKALKDALKEAKTKQESLESC